MTGISSLDSEDARAWLKHIRGAEATKTGVMLPMSVLICAVYKILQDPLDHHTVEIYNVMTTRENAISDPRVGESLSSGRVIFERSYDEEFAD